MALDFYEEETQETPQVLMKVIGVGGGGCNAVRQMMDFDLDGVELICANTDMQVLKSSPIKNKLQLGVKTTKGMGAGSNPEKGRLAAEEDVEHIREKLAGADMVFIATGMGGGTGTGASPVIASVAREMGILTMAIVTKPFIYEGSRRMRVAEEGIKVLKEEVDCLVVIPNDRISAVMETDSRLLDSFRAVDNVLKNGVQSIANVIQKEGTINTDLEDVKTIMSDRGLAMLGSGEAQGVDRARTATEKAISSPLLENINLSAARGLLVNISASKDIKTPEYTAVCELIYSLIDDELVNVKIGLLIDDDLEDTLRVTVVATGIDDQEEDFVEDFSGLLSTPSAKTNQKSADAETPKVGGKGDGYVDDSGLNLPFILRRKAK